MGSYEDVSQFRGRKEDEEVPGPLCSTSKSDKHPYHGPSAEDWTPRIEDYFVDLRYRLWEDRHFHGQRSRRTLVLRKALLEL
jgi:hypothetical protein